MPNYTQDPDDEKKVGPGSLPDNYYDRAEIVTFYENHKTPNSVYFGDLNKDVGFFFGSSASFAKLDIPLTGFETITASKDSKQVEGVGTKFDTELIATDKIEFISASASQVLIVSNISASTSMSLTENYTLNDFTGSAYDTKVRRKRSWNASSYEDYGKPTPGSELMINPLAVSGSNSDSGSNILFIYKGGLDGSPRPF